MIDSNPTPNFKYSMLLCCQIRDILSTYTPTRELYEFAKTIIMVRVGTPHQFVFGNLMQWYMTDSNRTPKFIIAYFYVVKTDTYLVYIAQLNIYQFTKMFNMFRVGTPQPFLFKN